jgi:hypothetical protein
VQTCKGDYLTFIGFIDLRSKVLLFLGTQ